MITELEYAENRIRLGAKAHFHDGIWWQAPYPFYAKPMFEFRPFDPGTARPSRRRAPLGYSHWVERPASANRFLEYMVLERDRLREFSLEALPAKKRNQVRKGLRCCDVRRLDRAEDYLEEIRGLYISQAQRHMANYDAPETHPAFYSEHRAKWEARERALFACSGREVWGAFVEENLAAILVSTQVEKVRLIEKVKTRTEMLPFCPSDALYFTVLQYAAEGGSCERVINPGVRGSGLERYKEQFLFERTAIPVYVSHPQLLALRERLSALGGSNRSSVEHGGAARAAGRSGTAERREERRTRGDAD